VKIVVMKRPPSSGGEHTAEDSYSSVLSMILSQLFEDAAMCRKTIVYMKLTWCGFAYNMFHREY